jgi:hypothetical protein
MYRNMTTILIGLTLSCVGFVGVASPAGAVGQEIGSDLTVADRGVDVAPQPFPSGWTRCSDWMTVGSALVSARVCLEHSFVARRYSTWAEVRNLTPVYNRPGLPVSVILRYRTSSHGGAGGLRGGSCTIAEHGTQRCSGQSVSSDQPVTGAQAEIAYGAARTVLQV